MKSLVTVSFLALFSLTLAGTDPFDSPDYVPSIPYPGWENLNFTLYSGYLSLDNPTKAIHYVLVLSLNNWTTDPLAVWFNGGPGCSSMEGWLSEIGPYVVEDGQLSFNGSLNPYTWAANASFIWLESPAGVGFSYVDWSTEQFGDPVTTADQYTALKSFFVKFPKFQSHDLYLSGESYAGIYIPRLAHWIVANNTENYTINLKGILVGNGVANQSSLDFTTNEFLYYHQFIPDDLWNDFQICNSYPNAPSCIYSQNIIAQLTASVNPYDVYRYCYNDGVDGDCTTSLGYYFFLNNPAVKEALHVVPTITYVPCSNEVGENWDFVEPGSYPDYLYLMANSSVRILLYSGDTDSVVPYTDTLYWINQLGLNVTTPWTPWNTPDGQFAGFAQWYANLTLTTINGCGHMVPDWKRSQAQIMFNSFVFQTPPLVNS